MLRRSRVGTLSSEVPERSSFVISALLPLPPLRKTACRVSVHPSFQVVVLH